MSEQNGSFLNLNLNIAYLEKSTQAILSVNTGLSFLIPLVNFISFKSYK